MLHGAISRSKHTLPVFGRWDWSNIVGGHVLAISDPTHDLSEKTSIGWYLGSAEFDPIPSISAIAENIASRLGCSPVFYGSSAGGFAAASLAARSGGLGIAINPQTDLVRYGKGTRALAKLFGEEDPAIAQSKYAERWMLHRILLSKRPARLVIAQNTSDQEHLEGHFLPICKALGIAPGQVSHPFAAMTFDRSGGHNVRESASDVMRFIEMLEGR